MGSLFQARHRGSGNAISTRLSSVTEFRLPPRLLLFGFLGDANLNADPLLKEAFPTARSELDRVFDDAPPIWLPRKHRSGLVA